ncbi:peptidylprolyl isomerase fpr3 [Ciborinia camelliae]|nr:peptidylprolyl isomerase fpr3 [Ciborinia camelliae]
MPLLPVAMYGLEVPAGDIIIPAVPDFPATFRITMAALDPTEPADDVEDGVKPRATLKIIRQSSGGDDEDSEDEDEGSDDLLRALLADNDSGSDEDSEDDDEEANGGPSDPSKSKKAQKKAALKELLASIGKDDSDEEMEDASAKKAASKGKAKATADDEEESEEESEDGEDIEIEEYVLCTLDPENHYQQPLDITIGEDETVFFKVTGTHTIYLTGNYVIPDDNGHNHHHEVYDSDDEDDEDYDLSPDEDELELEMDSDASDELDGARITEVDSEEEEAPKLVKADKKGKNKRSAAELEEAASLDAIIAKEAAAEEPKLSKKQQKKLKKNNGEAAPVKAEEAKKEAKKEAVKDEKADKKVQFAKNLEQGPTGSAAPKVDAKKAGLGVRTVDGVKIDDKKLGSGPVAKKGNRVGMRYIGKFTDGKVFDSNKKGKPFSFKLGAGEVIKGWDIGVAGMSAGGERRLTIPAHLAYGSKGVPGIPGNSTLTFDVKLLEIK